MAISCYSSREKNQGSVYAVGDPKIRQDRRRRQGMGEWEQANELATRKWEGGKKSRCSKRQATTHTG